MPEKDSTYRREQDPDATVIGDGPRHALGTESPGMSIGPYTLVSELGHGGFGVVWLAERKEPFVQQVAIKVIKPGMDTRAVIARFERERQVLAGMSHPSIAQVIDGGATASGRPYFVMEYVRGEPIDIFCDRRRASVASRVRLLDRVCAAMHHAHNKGVVHRDIKPSNVLVTQLPGDAPLVKVIDFGISKALFPSASESEVHTTEGQPIGTYEFMSPEQVNPTASGPDARTDIYAVGALMHLLLAGCLPYDPRLLRGGSSERAARIISGTELRPPSERFRTLGDARFAVAEARKCSVDELEVLLRDRFDAIVMRMLAKSPSDRPQSMLELRKELSGTISASVAVPGARVPPNRPARDRPQGRRPDRSRDGEVRVDAPPDRGVEVERAAPVEHARNAKTGGSWFVKFLRRAPTVLPSIAAFTGTAVLLYSMLGPTPRVTPWQVGTAVLVSATVWAAVRLAGYLATLPLGGAPEGMLPHRVTWYAPFILAALGLLVGQSTVGRKLGLHLAVDQLTASAVGPVTPPGMFTNPVLWCARITQGRVVGAAGLAIRNSSGSLSARVYVERLAVFPVAGTGNADSAWAYAPGGPERFHWEGRDFIRCEGDWFVGVRSNEKVSPEEQPAPAPPQRGSVKKPDSSRPEDAFRAGGG